MGPAGSTLGIMRACPRRATSGRLAALAVASLGSLDRSPSAVGMGYGCGSEFILYSSDWSGTAGQICAADPATADSCWSAHVRTRAGVQGRQPLRVRRARPSPAGSRTLFWDTISASCGAAPVVTGADGRPRRRVADAAALHPRGRLVAEAGRIAYLGRDGMHVIRADGSGDRLLGGGAGAFALGWSRDSPGVQGENGSLLVARAGRTAKLLGFPWTARLVAGLPLDHAATAS